MIKSAFILFGCSVALLAAQPKPAPTFDPPRFVSATQTSLTRLYLCDMQGVGVTLPDGELLRSTGIGDSKYWEVKAVEEDRRDFTVRPRDPLTPQTVLNVATNHDTHYAFLLLLNQGHCDSHVTLEADADLRKTIDAAPAWVAPEVHEADQKTIEAEKKATAEALKKIEEVQKQVQADEDTFRSEYPEKLVFDYDYDHQQAEKFGVKAIFRDGRFTYIRIDTHEPPVLSEMKGGKLSTIDYRYKNGTYRTARMIDEGFLVRGGTGNGKHQEKFKFWRHSDHDSWDKEAN